MALIMNIIVAVDNNYGIGDNNKLLYHIPEDMKFFREKTLNKVVVMGRNTLESLPHSKPLKNRTNIIMTKNKNYKVEDAIVCHSKEALYEVLKNYESNDVYIIGGESIYKEFLCSCKYLYITKINSTLSADKFFPYIERMSKWEKIHESNIKTDNHYTFKFTTYENKDLA